MLAYMESLTLLALTGILYDDPGAGSGFLLNSDGGWWVCESVIDESE